MSHTIPGVNMAALQADLLTIRGRYINKGHKTEADRVGFCKDIRALSEKYPTLSGHFDTMARTCAKSGFAGLSHLA